MDSFYVTLPSNVSSFETNTISKFKTKLASKIKLDGKWTVALTSIKYTKSWYNVSRNLLISTYVLNEKTENPVKTFDNRNFNGLNQGHYKDIQEIIKYVNDRINDNVPGNDFSILFNPYDSRCHIEWNSSKIVMNFDKELLQILGIDKQPSELKDECDICILNGVRAADSSGGIHSIYVYTDIIEPNFVGNTIVPLLQTVNVEKGDFGQDCFVEFTNPLYHNVLGNEFETIEINIRDDSGKQIPFQFGKVVLTLHFKRWKDTT